jgi:hypothetical protein
LETHIAPTLISQTLELHLQTAGWILPMPELRVRVADWLSQAVLPGHSMRATARDSHSMPGGDLPKWLEMGLSQALLQMAMARAFLALPGLSVWLPAPCLGTVPLPARALPLLESGLCSGQSPALERKAHAGK